MTTELEIRIAGEDECMAVAHRTRRRRAFPSTFPSRLLLRRRTARCVYQELDLVANRVGVVLRRHALVDSVRALHVGPLHAEGLEAVELLRHLTVVALVGSPEDEARCNDRVWKALTDRAREECKRGRIDRRNRTCLPGRTARAHLHARIVHHRTRTFFD